MMSPGYKPAGVKAMRQLNLFDESERPTGSWIAEFGLSLLPGSRLSDLIAQIRRDLAAIASCDEHDATLRQFLEERVALYRADVTGGER